MTTEIDIARIELDLLVTKEKITSVEQKTLRRQLKALTAERLKIRDQIQKKSTEIAALKSNAQIEIPF